MSPQKLNTQCVAACLLGAQVLAAMVVLVAGLGPAGDGMALYVPLRHSSQSEVIDWTAKHDASLVGAGPLPGSLVIRTSDSANFLSAAADGAILVAMPGFLCGETSKPRESK